MDVEGRGKTISLHLNIDGFLRNNSYPKDFEGLVHALDGGPVSPAQALTFLTLEKAKGRKVIPCSAECGNPCKHADKGCTGFDYSGGGCPGRYTEAPGAKLDDDETRAT